MSTYVSGRLIIHLDSIGTYNGLCTTSNNSDIGLALGMGLVSSLMFNILLQVLVLASLPTILAKTKSTTTYLLLCLSWTEESDITSHSE